MNPERWARIERLYERARLLPEDQWPLFLAGEAGDDIAIVDDVLQMLRARASGDFIEPPPSGGAPRPAPEGDAWIGRKLGEYEIVSKFEGGGMGLVFRAYQPSLKRHVALKILPFQSFSRPSHVARFEKEARIAAQLNHKNIVKIHEVHVDGDMRWFTMELVDGPDLAKEIARVKSTGTAKDARLPPYESSEYVTKVVTLVAQAADALECAHAAGIVHRDIKPGNLLVDSAGEVRVIDFGLARHDERDESGAALPPLTRPDDLLGTPHYMSPEQVRRKSHRVDGRTDVWSLGVVLYELLSLKKPFDGGTSLEIARKITDEQPVPLSKIARRVPWDLETICLTAMGREPSDRYSSAGQFRDDLRRFLAHQAIVAKRPPLLRQVARHVRRRQALYAAAAVALAALAGGMVASGMRERAKRLDDDVALFREVAACGSLEREIPKVAVARERLAVRERELDDLDDDEAAAVRGARRRIEEDRAERYVVGRGKLNAGMADRSDVKRFGSYLSGPSEREIGEALTYLAVAHAIHPDDPELASLANLESGFPELSIRLSDEAKAAPRAAKARAWAVPFDDVRDEMGTARVLGPVPFDGRLASGHWRIVVEVPEWGISEHSRDLVPSVLVHEIVARVLPASSLEAGMKRFDGGIFAFKNDASSTMGCGKVLGQAAFDAYWIDEAELSNRQVVEWLEGSGAPPPRHWSMVGCRGRDWRELPIGDLGDRWLDLPAVMLTGAEAAACAEWHGKRLPTHVELERAIRGPEGWFHPWNSDTRSDVGGRCNIDGKSEDWDDVPEYYALYLRYALPVRAEGFRQRPEGLFHAYGNVAEMTDTFLVEETEGRLIAFPWQRLNLGASWDAAARQHSMAMHAHSEATVHYLRNYIGVRLARSAAAPKSSSDGR